MFFKLKSHIKFLLKSTNEHGVHSPFVFDFVTKGLYSKKQWNQHKTIDVLLKSISHFKVQSIMIPDDPEIKRILQDIHPKLKFESDTIDLLFDPALDQTKLEQLISEKILHNGSMILIDGIHSNPQKEKCWQDLVQLPKVTVSIDMFHCGALFIRKEQVKEHFTIRI